MARSSASLSFSKSSSMELTCSAIRPSLRRSLPSPARMTLSMMAGTSRRAPRGSGCERDRRPRPGGRTPAAAAACRHSALPSHRRRVAGESEPCCAAPWPPGKHTGPNAGAGGGDPGGLATIIGSRRPQRHGPRTRGEQNAWQTRRARAPWPASARKRGALAQPGSPSYQAPEPFHGRPVSWVAVSIIMAGFLVGGLGLVFGPTWWLFWAGARRGDRRRAAGARDPHLRGLVLRIPAVSSRARRRRGPGQKCRRPPLGWRIRGRPPCPGTGIVPVRRRCAADDAARAGVHRHRGPPRRGARDAAPARRGPARHHQRARPLPRAGGLRPARPRPAGADRAGVLAPAPAGRLRVLVACRLRAADRGMALLRVPPPCPARPRQALASEPPGHLRRGAGPAPGRRPAHGHPARRGQERRRLVGLVGYQDRGRVAAGRGRRDLRAPGGLAPGVRPARSGFSPATCSPTSPPTPSAWPISLPRRPGAWAW